MDRPWPKTHRLAPAAYAATENVFHLVLHAFPGLTPFAGRVGDLVWANVLSEAEADRVAILAACLMPDHLHILLRPSKQNVARWTGSFKSSTTAAAWTCGHRGRLWQPSFFDRLIRSDLEFATVQQYLRENPARAELTAPGEHWPWYYERPA